MARKTKNTTGNTQEELDREDALLRDKKHSKEMEKFVKPLFSFLEKNERFLELSHERVAFVMMICQPKEARPTMKEIAEQLKVSEVSLYNWQKEELVMELRRELMMLYWRHHTPDIIQNLAEIASAKGEINPVPAIKLWLQFIEEWKESSNISLDMPPVTFGFPPSQFIKPTDKKKAQQSLAQKHTKDVKVMLGKKNKKSVVQTLRKK